MDDLARKVREAAAHIDPGWDDERAERVLAETLSRARRRRTGLWIAAAAAVLLSVHSATSSSGSTVKVIVPSGQESVKGWTQETEPVAGTGPGTVIGSSSPQSLVMSTGTSPRWSTQPRRRSRPAWRT